MTGWICARTWALARTDKARALGFTRLLLLRLAEDRDCAILVYR